MGSEIQGAGYFPRCAIFFCEQLWFVLRLTKMEVISEMPPGDWGLDFLSEKVITCSAVANMVISMIYLLAPVRVNIPLIVGIHR